MFGLMALGAAALYLGLMFVVMQWAWRIVRVNGGSMRKAALYSGLGFLLVYLPVFWNHFPVLLAHRSMCSKDAGFLTYVAPSQWIAQNKERLAARYEVSIWASKKGENLTTGHTVDIYFFGLLQAERKEERFRKFGVLFIRSETVDRDVSTGKQIARGIDYWVGQRDDARFWLHRQTCLSSSERSLASRRQSFIQQLEVGIN